MARTSFRDLGGEEESGRYFGRVCMLRSIHPGCDVYRTGMAGRLHIVAGGRRAV